ncbi:MBL fold metallo-hydrolase [Neobacillus sp. LXY-4]|uniref:MBL fold metallo-hydrolase n=1 Tax=Neobacillus sp. LXY-4 TaxID=3379826 RepID=UPI003EE20AF6
MDLKTNGVEVIPIIVPDQSGLKSINFYLIKHGQSLSLIDAGWNNNECWDALIKTLGDNGFSLRDLTEIILTHHHNDHVGLVNRIITEHPIPVYASPLSILRLKRDQSFLEMRADFYAKLYREMGCGESGEKQITYLKSAIQKNKHNAVVADITEIVDPTLLNFDVIPVPGHAPDQLSFYQKNNNWLFVGDLLIEHIAVNALVEPGSEGQRMPTLVQHIDSLNKVLKLNADVAFSGHGSLIHNPGELINKRLTGIEEKSRRILELIESGISTGNALALIYHKKRYDGQFSLVMSEIIGHLDYLESQGKVEKDFVGGIWHYSVSKV